MRPGSWLAMTPAFRLRWGRPASPPAAQALSRTPRLSRVPCLSRVPRPLQLSGQVRLQRLADGRHVIRIPKVGPDQAVQPPARRYFLRRRCADHGVGSHLDLPAADLAEVDLSEPGRVREQYLQLVVRLRAPEAGLHRQRPADVSRVVQQPGPARVDEVRLPVVAERDLLAEPETLDRGIAAHARALPAAEQEKQRTEARVRLILHAGQGRTTGPSPRGEASVPCPPNSTRAAARPAARTTRPPWR